MSILHLIIIIFVDPSQLYKKIINILICID